MKMPVEDNIDNLWGLLGVEPPTPPKEYAIAGTRARLLILQKNFERYTEIPGKQCLCGQVLTEGTRQQDTTGSWVCNNPTACHKRMQAVLLDLERVRVQGNSERLGIYSHNTPLAQMSNSSCYYCDTNLTPENGRSSGFERWECLDWRQCQIKSEQTNGRVRPEAYTADQAFLQALQDDSHFSISCRLCGKGWSNSNPLRAVAMGVWECGGTCDLSVKACIDCGEPIPSGTLTCEDREECGERRGAVVIGQCYCGQAVTRANSWLWSGGHDCRDREACSHRLAALTTNTPLGVSCVECGEPLHVGGYTRSADRTFTCSDNGACVLRQL